MTDGASAIARRQQDGATNLPVYQNNGATNLPAYQNNGATNFPAYQNSTRPATTAMDSTIPRPDPTFGNDKRVYPCLSQMDTMTARTATDNNGGMATGVTNAKGSYPAVGHHQTLQKRVIHPTSITSLGSQMSNHTNRTVRHLRERDLECFTYSQEFQDVLQHIERYKDQMQTRMRTSQEETQQARDMRNSLGPIVDDALDKAFSSGNLSSGLMNLGKEFTPTEESVDYFNKTDTASRMKQV